MFAWKRVIRLLLRQHLLRGVREIGVERSDSMRYAALMTIS